MNAHISQYCHGNRENHPPVRNRKLLLHRREIDKLLGKTREKGLSLIPTKVYLKQGRIKCEVAVARGKKLHDKRETERARTAEAEARAARPRQQGRQADNETNYANQSGTPAHRRSIETEALVLFLCFRTAGKTGWVWASCSTRARSPASRSR